MPAVRIAQGESRAKEKSRESVRPVGRHDRRCLHIRDVCTRFIFRRSKKNRQHVIGITIGHLADWYLLCISLKCARFSTDTCNDVEVARDLLKDTMGLRVYENVV